MILYIITSKIGKYKYMSKSKMKKLENNSVKKDDLYFYALLIILITFIAFIPSLSNGFTNWDDDVYILENWKIRQINLENLYYIFTSTHHGGYEPLTELSFAIDYFLFKLNPFFYHLKNIIFHLLNAILVYWLIFLFTKRIDISFFAALFFSVHPMRVESVTWISERKDVLYSFFYLLSLISYIYYINTKNKKFFYYSLFLYFFSLLPKAQALFYPFVLILIDYFLNRRINKKVLFEKIPFFLISGLFFIILYIGHKQTKQIISETTETFFKNLMYANFGFVFYLIKYLFPFKLSNCYPLPDKFWDGIFHWIYLFSPLIVVMIIFLVYLKRKNKDVIFTFFFYLLNLLLVLQLKRTGPNIVADRYTYIPYISLSYLTSITFFFYYDKLKNNNLKKFFYVFLILIIGIFSFLTFQRTKVWKDSPTLWNDTLKKYPKNPVAYNHLALYYKNEKNYDMAISYFKKALEYDPYYFAVYNNLGTLYHDKNEYESAIEWYMKGLKINPSSHQLYYNIGFAYHKLGKLDDAIDYYKKALVLKKDYLSVLNNLSRALLEKRSLKEATDYIKQALSFNPDYLLAYVTYSDILVEQNKYEEAENILLKASRIDNQSHLVKYKLALLYEKKGEDERAIKNLEEIVNKDKTNIEPYLAIIKIYLKLNRIDLVTKYIELAENIEKENQEILKIKKDINSKL